jgi:hypothetical protein
MEKAPNTNIASAKVVVVTPELARHLRDTCHFERQRPINKGNVQRLEIEMTKRRFIQATPIFFCVLPDAQAVIVNGNHTLEAVAASGVPQVLTFIALQVPNIRVAGDVYASFDMHKARSWLDALKAVGLDDTVEMSDRVLPAVGVIMNGFKYNRQAIEANRSRPARFDALLDYKTEASMMYQALDGAPSANRRLILRAAVLAVALETVKYQASAAVTFWREMAMDDALSNGDPRKTLLRYLQNTKTGGGPSQAFHMSKAAALAWNASFRGHTLHVCRPSQGDNFVLLGTPWGTKNFSGYVMGGPVEPEEIDAVTEVEPELPDLEDLLTTGLTMGPGGFNPVTFFKPAGH